MHRERMDGVGEFCFFCLSFKWVTLPTFIEIFKSLRAFISRLWFSNLSNFAAATHWNKRTVSYLVSTETDILNP